MTSGPGGTTLLVRTGRNNVRNLRNLRGRASSWAPLGHSGLGWALSVHRNIRRKK